MLRPTSGNLKVSETHDMIKKCHSHSGILASRFHAPDVRSSLIAAGMTTYGS